MRSGQLCFANRFFSESLKTTPLYDAHVELGGKMVDFAGYALPVQYKASIMDSHVHCRMEAALFDVSHMGQVILQGEGHIAFLESLTVADIEALETNQGRLSLLMNEKGGIMDDCVITKKADRIYMVVNAGCKDKDLEHMRAKLQEWNAAHKANVTLDLIEDRALIALQGPTAQSVLEGLVSIDLSAMPFMFHEEIESGLLEGCWITRCGYTGEDGFEISIAPDKGEAVFKLLLQQPTVKPAGLAVRDSLRLEAGLCLYGHELNEDTTPNEAILMWTITKRRRQEGGFPGHARVMSLLADKSKLLTQKRVGLTVLKGPPAREGAELLSNDNKIIGTITSGTFSPTLKAKIAMGYVDKAFAKVGTELQVQVRGKTYPAVVTKMPFVDCHYFKPSA